MDGLHFRIEQPVERGKLQRGGRVFVTFPGEAERELPRVRSITAHAGATDALEVTVKFIGTIEFVYPDDPIAGPHDTMYAMQESQTK